MFSETSDFSSNFTDIKIMPENIKKLNMAILDDKNNTLGTSFMSVNSNISQRRLPPSMRNIKSPSLLHRRRQKELALRQDMHLNLQKKIEKQKAKRLKKEHESVQNHKISRARENLEKKQRLRKLRKKSKIEQLKGKSMFLEEEPEEPVHERLGNWYLEKQKKLMIKKQKLFKEMTESKSPNKRKKSRSRQNQANSIKLNKQEIIEKEEKRRTKIDNIVKRLTDPDRLKQSPQQKSKTKSIQSNKDIISPYREKRRTRKMRRKELKEMGMIGELDLTRIKDPLKMSRRLKNEASYFDKNKRKRVKHKGNSKKGNWRLKQIREERSSDSSYSNSPVEVSENDFEVWDSKEQYYKNLNNRLEMENVKSKAKSELLKEAKAKEDTTVINETIKNMKNVLKRKKERYLVDGPKRKGKDYEKINRERVKGKFRNRKIEKKEPKIEEVRSDKEKGLDGAERKTARDEISTSSNSSSYMIQTTIVDDLDEALQGIVEDHGSGKKGGSQFPTYYIEDFNDE